MKIWPRTRENTEQKHNWRWLTQKWFEDPAGNEQEFTTYSRPGSSSVAVIALTPEHNVVIARQFRPGPEKIFEEIPGGAVDEGEDLDVAATRELHEETGYTPEHIEYLGEVCTGAYTNDRSHFYLATGCVQNAEPHPDEGEFIEVDTIAIDELFANARSAKMSDVGAVFLAYEKLTQIQKEM